MKNEERLNIINSLYLKKEELDEDLKEKLQYDKSWDAYKFLIENDYLAMTSYKDESKYHIITHNEYFILRHLLANNKRPLGENELINDLGLKTKTFNDSMLSLINKGVVKKHEIEKENFYTKIPLYAIINILGGNLDNYIENQYFLRISKLKNKINIDEDKQNELLKLRKTKNRLQNFVTVFNVLGKFILALSIMALIVLGFLFHKIEFLLFWKLITSSIAGFILSISFISQKYKNNDQYIDYKISELENDIELREMNATNIEKRAEKLFKSHQLELSQYYKEILNQSKRIFNFGIVLIVFGFTIIIISLLIVSLSKNQLITDNKIFITILGSISGVLSNFIAIIFLNMYNKTIESLNSFHDRFVNTHHLHFGNLLLSKIKDEEIREKAFADIYKDWKK